MPKFTVQNHFSDTSGILANKKPYWCDQNMSLSLSDVQHMPIWHSLNFLMNKLVKRWSNSTVFLPWSGK